MEKIFQLKITLKESKPSIWRRFLVPENINLHKLHEVIQTVMGWEDDHLYAFVIKGKNYNGQPELDYEDDSEENKQTRSTLLNKLINKENQTFSYDYDFGDNWEHDIVLEKITAKEPDKFYPVCIEGKNACPPEDVGGIYGYYETLEQLKNGNLDENELECTFGDEEFNPEEFNVEQVNEELQDYFGISQEILDKYTEPVTKLLTLGDPRESKTKEWLDYYSLGITEKDIPQLIELLTDMDLYYLDSDNPAVWSTLHTWRALGQLKGKEAIIPLINILVDKELEDDDWIREEIPVVLGMIGEDCIDPLKAYLYDQSKPEWPKVMISHGLEQIGQKVPSRKEEIVKIFSDFLDQATAKTPELNGFIINYLIDLKAVNSIESIRNAYKKEIVDFSVNGDLEDTEIELGLREKRITPAKNYLKEKYFDFSTEIKSVEKKAKIGRNEPCPCGSGKKYKKCCLQNSD